MERRPGSAKKSPSWFLPSGLATGNLGIPSHLRTSRFGRYRSMNLVRQLTAQQTAHTDRQTCPLPPAALHNVAVAASVHSRPRSHYLP